MSESRLTEVSNSPGGWIRLAASGEIPQKQAPLKAKAQKDRAEGAVIAFNETVVTCNIHRDAGGDLQVRLARGLFDFDVGLGTPIYLSMDIRGGYRTAVVERRELNPAADPLFDELTKMIGQLTLNA